MGGCRARL
jgi:uncharacterized protein YjbJ (UPF0337 family)